jgi:site-specific DNA-cytosine methylase
VEQPKDCGIILKDILLSEACEPVLSNVYGGFNEKEPREHYLKSPTIRTPTGGGNIPSVVLRDKSNCVCSSGRGSPLDSRQVWDSPYKLTDKEVVYCQRLFNNKPRLQTYSNDSDKDKSRTVTANFFRGVPYNVLNDSGLLRKFSPIECERLQTLPNNYTAGVSNSQRYKMIGNGWTVDVIAHIFRSLPTEWKL